MKQAPRRMCVGCRTTRAKPELLRLVSTPDGVVIDADQVLPGRGAYVCPTQGCVEILVRAQGQPLRRALREADPNTTAVALSELNDQLSGPPQSTGRQHGAGTTSNVRSATPRSTRR